MEDFAAVLVSAREKTGLTQAQVATRAGLTPSYLSFIENRKKPPPSDDVCQRLADVLGIPAKRLIEIAHIERAPDSVRRRLRTLRRSLTREKRSRRRLLERLLSPFLFAGPPGYLEGALDRVGISAPRRRKIREALDAVGREHQDQAEEVARIIDSLPERDRTALLEALPRLLSEEASKARAAAGAEGPGPASAGAGSAPAVPEFHYGPPPAEAGEGPPYLLAVSPRMAEGLDELREGDRIVVDPRVAPGPGDLIAVRGEREIEVRRIRIEGSGLRVVDAGHAGNRERLPPEPMRPERLRAYLGAVGLGTIVEVRRPLRHPGAETGSP
jgi:transcriptional regulator with XRE-family HTH domain